MADKIQLIKEEIERLKDCQSPIVICDTLLQFIDSLPEEPRPRFPHEENIVDKVFGAGNLESFEYSEAEQLVSLAKEELLKDIEISEEFSTKVLEEEATRFVKTKEFCESEESPVILIARYFAEWQKQQMKETLKTEYEKGRLDMQQEMMKDAVDAIFIQDYAYKTPVLYGDLKYKMNIVSGQPIKLYQIKKEQL